MKHSFKLRPLCAVIALISAFSLLLSSCGGSKDPASSTGSASTSSTSSSTGGSIMDQRRANAQRNDYQRQGE